jgi:hypothetical protein
VPHQNYVLQVLFRQCAGHVGDVCL